MKIIISPAKKLLKTNYSFKNTIPEFEDKAIECALKIKDLDILEIEKAFKVKKPLAINVLNMYKNFNKEKHMAIFLYNGLQFKNINSSSFNEKEFKFLNDNTIILDALYGFLKPSDSISNYRLDYNTNLPFINKSYFSSISRSYFNNEKIINLASKEYSSIIPSDLLFTINFVQEVNNVTKSYSTHTKIARGKFLNYIVKKQSTSLETLKSFNLDSYKLICEDENGLTFKKL